MTKETDERVENYSRAIVEAREVVRRKEAAELIQTTQEREAAKASGTSPESKPEPAPKTLSPSQFDAALSIATDTNASPEFRKLAQTAVENHWKATRENE